LETNDAIELDKKGQYPYNISNSMTPKDQISAFEVYDSPLRTSGAM
jgi:hypothetical protein